MDRQTGRQGRRTSHKPGMKTLSSHPSTEKAEAGKSRVQDQLRLFKEFQASPGYKVRACQKKTQKPIQQTKRHAAAAAHTLRGTELGLGLGTNSVGVPEGCQGRRHRGFSIRMRARRHREETGEGQWRGHGGAGFPLNKFTFTGAKPTKRLLDKFPHHASTLSHRGRGARWGRLR